MDGGGGRYSNQIEEKEGKNENCEENTQQIKDEKTLSFDEETEEVTRMKRYDGVRVRGMRITLRSQVAIEEIFERTIRLKEDDAFRDVFVKSLND